MTVIMSEVQTFDFAIFTERLREAKSRLNSAIPINLMNVLLT